MQAYGTQSGTTTSTGNGASTAPNNVIGNINGSATQEDSQKTMIISLT